jgi:O-antigen ligase/polysaccharide polymerase Wzy-like membrane protein
MILPANPAGLLIAGARRERSRIGATPILALAGVAGLWLLIASNSPDTIAATALAAGALFIIWAAWRVQSDGAYLLCALVMIELLCSATLLPVTEEQRFLIRYPLLLLFGLPAAIGSLRNSLLWRGGFRDYLLYLGWGAVSITYSLLPGYSLARVTAAILIYVVSVKIASDVKDTAGMHRLFKWFVAALGVVWIGLAATLLAAPHDLAWSTEEISGMMRFRGFFGSPNQVGEITLATVAAAAMVWRAASGRQKFWIALEIAAAVAMGAMADSRSPFVGLALGGLGYLLWRYRLRAVPICLAAAVTLFAAATVVAPDYFTRGEVSTLTGRTDVWKFAVQEIKQRPLLGYGFEVEGQILQSKYFPVWWGPWEEGPHSSLHNGYLSRAVGVGVPALAFWLFLFMRPWVWLLGRKQDPWQLKRMFLLVIVPILVLNMVETTAGDCRYSVGLLATLCWAFAERQRLQYRDARRQRAQAAALPLLAQMSLSPIATIPEPK